MYLKITSFIQQTQKRVLDITRKLELLYDSLRENSVSTNIINLNYIKYYFIFFLSFIYFETLIL